VERCLETAAQLSASATFWRPGSRRRAVCVTDAPEQSPFPLAAVAVLADAGVRWDVIARRKCRPMEAAWSRTSTTAATCSPRLRSAAQ